MRYRFSSLRGLSMEFKMPVAHELHGPSPWPVPWIASQMLEPFRLAPHCRKRNEACLVYCNLLRETAEDWVALERTVVVVPVLHCTFNTTFNTPVPHQGHTHVHVPAQVARERGLSCVGVRMVHCHKDSPVFGEARCRFPRRRQPHRCAFSVINRYFVRKLSGATESVQDIQNVDKMP